MIIFKIKGVRLDKMCKRSGQVVVWLTVNILININGSYHKCKRYHDGYICNIEDIRT